MKIELLLGNQAVAVGALDAGIAGVFSYPGTPATEIFETIAERGGAAARWSANEKVAYEEALGMAYVGKRALVSMKHVGLNVAADPFVNSALTGVNAGLVVVVADDPGMHSSQNEQDSRFYGEFAQIPVFEPATQQEAYDLTREAFAYSEAIGLPVMIRLVTRLAHSRSNVTRSEPVDPSELARRNRERPPEPENWTLVPANARRRFRHLVDLQKTLIEDSERSDRNHLALAGRRGVIAAGIGHNYVLEALGGSGDVSLLKIARYPLPPAKIRALVDHCDEIWIVEDGYPYIERRLCGLLGVPGKAIRGKLTGDLPPTGELTPDALALALGGKRNPGMPPLPGLSPRPPQLCKGCPHTDTFRAVIEAVSGFGHPHLFGDIGCYTLGVLPPYRAVHTCVDMGASIAMAHGAAMAGARPVLATIGDSTFGHSGMTALLGAVQDDADMTVLILDNATVAMTGTQDSMTSGEDLLRILRGLGVQEDHLHVVNPLPQHHDANVALIRGEIAHPGLSVIVPTRACIHVRRKHREGEPAATRPAESATV